MVADTERLVVAVESRVTDFDRGMKAVERRMKRMERALSGELRQVERASRDAARTMEREFDTATSRIERQFQGFRNAARTALVGAGAAATAFISAQTVTQISEAAGEIANLRAEADRAGVAFGDFQRLKFASEQQRVSIDALTDGLKELNLRADEFIVSGKGSAAEAFERIGFGADELSRKLHDPADLLLEILRRVEDLDRAAQIRIFDELFGGQGGEQFVQLLRDGADGFAQSMGEAAVFSDEIADKAAETDAAFRALASNLNVAIKTAVVTIADILDTWIAKAQAFVSTLSQGIADVGARIGNSSIFRRLADLVGGDTALLGVPLQMLGEQNTPFPNSAPPGVRGIPAAAPRASQPFVPSVPPTRAATDGAREYVDVIKEAADATDEAAAAQDRLRERGENLQDAFTGITVPITDALEGILFEWEKASEAIGRLALKVAEMVLQGSLLQQGPLGGILGNLFGGFLANGGPATAGKGYIVGERGPEWFQPSTSGRIFDAATTKSALQRATSVPSAGTAQPARESKATLTVNLDPGLRAELNGEMQDVATRITSAGLERYTRSALPQAVANIQRSPRVRG